MTLPLFLLQVFIISFSGAMQPGPVTATAINMGVNNRWAGALLAIGHGIIELPLMILIVLGVGFIFQTTAVQITVGLAGGAVLLYMAVEMFRASKKQISPQTGAKNNNPILAGILLTASNPYFLAWWATVGLAIATTAAEFGIWGFALFVVVHWLVDLVWVEALSFAGFHGTVLLGPELQKIVLKICSAAMLFFALFFFYKAIMRIV